MNVIFLDVDGVLNCRSTKERCNGYLGIDDDKVRRLRQIVDATGAAIVLSSTWKDNWERKRKELQDELANYLDQKLKNEGMEILDKTEDEYWDRGAGILKWIDTHSVDSFVILDDIQFDYEELGLLDRFVETSVGASNGGLQEDHVKRAIEILEKGKTSQ